MRLPTCARPVRRDPGAKLFATRVTSAAICETKGHGGGGGPGHRGQISSIEADIVESTSATILCAAALLGIPSAASFKLTADPKNPTASKQKSAGPSGLRSSSGPSEPGFLPEGPTYTSGKYRRGRMTAGPT